MTICDCGDTRATRHRSQEAEPNTDSRASEDADGQGRRATLVALLPLKMELGVPMRRALPVTFPDDHVELGSLLRSG